MSELEHTPDFSGSSGPDTEGGARRNPGEGGGNWKAVLVVLLAVFTGLAGLAYYASHWKKEIVVREVVIEGAKIVPARELSRVLNGFVGRNLQNVDADAIRSRLLRIAYVRDVSVSRELNGIIRVRVVEREPLARTVFRNTPMIIDREGVLLPETPGAGLRVPGMIRVFGISRTMDAGTGLKRLSPGDSTLVMELTEALRKSDYAGLLIREIHLENRPMTFCRAAGSPTRFIVGSDGNFKEKLKKFEIFWQKVVSKKGLDNFDTVDLRFRGRIFTRDSVSPEVQQEATL